VRSSISCASAKIAALVTAILTLSDCSSVPLTSTPPVESSPTFRFPVVPAPAEGRALEPPISLTASDGTGLTLVRLTGRAVIEEPLAFTELHLVFENPEDRTIEGNFSVTLPDNAQVSRFAMRLDDRWQEGEVVEKRRAREAYEDFLHRKQDPALLEQAAGNAFSARVFPIPARGKKELILSYSQELPAQTTYVLPLRGLPQVGRIDLAVSLGGKGAPVNELTRESFTPDADFTLDPKVLKGGSGLRSGNLVLARVRPIADARPDPLASAIVLVDTSASRALGFEAEVHLVEGVVQQILSSSGRKTPISVACYDQTTDLLFDGEAGGFGEPELTRIRQRQAFGASDLGRALGWAGAQAKARGAKRVLLITDGVATAGETAQDKLRAAAGRLAAAGVERLDAIAVGGIRDDALLRQLVTAGLPRAGVVIDSAAGSEAMAKRLTEVTRSGIPVKIEGARFVYPDVLDGVQAGDEVLVYADVPPEQTVRISVDGGLSWGPDLVRAERPLLSRAFAQAKISSLLALSAKEGPDPAIEREIVALSVENRVMSPFTSLLVLETEWDYDRFNIDRRALVDILTIDGGRVAVMKRSGAPSKAPAPMTMDRDMDPGQRLADRRSPSSPSSPRSGPMAEAAKPRPAPSASPGDPLSARGNMWGDEIGEAFGAGGLGLSGVGEGGGGQAEGIGLGRIGVVGHGAGTGTGQGFGSGHGRLGGSHRSAAPTVRMGATQVSGRLPPEIIQRIVRQNFGRFRLCYEKGLRTSPALMGRVSVRFTILPTGVATKAVDAGSDLPDRSVVACVVRAFDGLSFPAPESGSVTVVYPVMFAPGDGDRATGASVAAARGGEPVAPARPEASKPAEAMPYTGRFKEVMDTIARGGVKEAIRGAYAWHQEAPGDVMALVALGEAFDAASEIPSAARAYGSIIDLFSSRADMRRFAGERLERLRGGAGLQLALDTYEKAVIARPDHPASHRLLAFARLKRGEPERAFEAALAGVEQRYPSGRFAGVDRILREDLGLIAAAWIKAEPRRRAEIEAKVKAAAGVVEDAPSLRFVLNWETDANDVDFHIYDDRGGHAYYGDKSLPSGGELYADVTTGYGPECFTIRGPKDSRAGRYTLQAHYYARGPMGFGMGKLEIIDHDGKGGLSFEERPFVVMADRAFVDLGSVAR
jgi:hypothetical protein